MLDCGSYERRLDYDQLVNMDIVSVRGVDVIGDGHHLPFKDNSFDLVLSQGVLEHCRQPFAAADELYRVCRYGGIIYVDAAFMQPVHGAPYHFFNMTELGIEELFKKFNKIESGSIGSLSSTIPWIVGSTSVSGRKLQYWLIKHIISYADRFVKPGEVKNVAGVVYFIGAKGPIDEKIMMTSRKYVTAGDRRVLKTGCWSTVVNYNAASGQLTWSGVPGDRLSFSYRGKDVKITALKHGWSGYMDVYLDGVKYSAINLYQSNADYGFEHTVRSKSEGDHTVEVVVSTRKDQRTKGSQVWIDRFEPV